MNIPEDKAESLLLINWAVLVGGCLAGLLAALLIISIPFDFSRQLAEAKRLGISSLTILNGYPKSRDVLSYVLIILMPIGFSLGSWLVWSRGRRGELAELFRSSELDVPAFSHRRLVPTLAILLVCLLIKFNINNFYEPAGGWAFLGEEGHLLADAQIILGGGDYARDFFCLYGPLVTYPLAWAMKIFGASVMVGRFYTYLVSLMAAVIMITFINRTIRGHIIFVAASCLMGALFISGGGRTTGTLLRVMLGLLPLLLLYLYSGKERKLPLLSTGVALGVSLLFSQEVGLCAGIAAFSYLLLEAFSTGTYRRLLCQLALVAGGWSLVVIPMLGYFYLQNALGRFFDSLYGYPKLVMLGYGALPFPSFLQFLAAPLSGAYFPYWMIGIYLLSAISLLVVLFLGLGNRDVHFKSALLVFGLLLFRAALGRSDESHFFFVLPPALLLAFLTLDNALRGAADSRVKMLATGRRVLVCVVLASLLLLLGTSRVLRENIVDVFSELRHFTGKFAVKETGVALPRLVRGGTYYDPATAEDLVKIGSALDRYTKPGEYVLFFPNEAAYYFLFNRRVPTRYVHAYFAISTEQRREMVADLERNRPKYVVYSLDTWRIDGISEDVQVPEVVEYLKHKYSLVEDLGSIHVLQRKINVTD